MKNVAETVVCQSCMTELDMSKPEMKNTFTVIGSALTIKQLLVEIAQHIHEVFTGFLWQDLPCEGSLIFIAGKTKIHNVFWGG